MLEKKISVRELVEFICRSGSLDSRFTGRNRLEEGSKIHRKLQKDGGENYRSEVFLSVTEERAGILFTVSGRADGIITEETGVMIDEIKSTLTPLQYIEDDTFPVHRAQAMCYGYIYCVNNRLENIRVRLTYFEMDTGEIKRFVSEYSFDELSAFFTRLLEEYACWARFESDWSTLSRASMKALSFPFEHFRGGQRLLAGAVYKTIAASGRLFAMAPTGIGKTVSTLFPSVKAAGEGYADKIFYLTAKTITRQAAQDALDIMREKGLRAKSVTITAKDKICFLPERICKPEYCEYANGHFDRINGAVLTVLRERDAITREVISDYARRMRVCPFELALDLTLWCDIIICDYNYLFDPQVYLKRFFSDSGGEYVFLVDEAHNLCDRARDMYSASVSKRELLAVKRLIGKQYKKLRSSLTAINKLLLEKLREMDNAVVAIEKEPPVELCKLLEVFAFEFSKWLPENDDPGQGLLEVYFNVLTYLKIAELFDERYVTLYETREGGGLRVKQLCADPSGLLCERYLYGRASILFSATLTPSSYFGSVLGGGEDYKYLALASPFPRENLLLLVADGIKTTYRERAGSLEDVAEMIYHTSAGKRGNYIAYFPSYAYLRDVFEVFCERYPDVNAVCQKSGMSEGEREEFLALFDGGGQIPLLAFCVLGGVFSEGIDLTGERLSGTVIVGTGLPQIGTELDIVRDYYGPDGFDYAYRLPGMNKVLQAAGRVIRGESDRGVVLLIDERFSSGRYRGLFPPHWDGYRTVRGICGLKTALSEFWS